MAHIIEKTVMVLGNEFPTVRTLCLEALGSEEKMLYILSAFHGVKRWQNGSIVTKMINKVKERGEIDMTIYESNLQHIYVILQEIVRLRTFYSGLLAAHEWDILAIKALLHEIDEFVIPDFPFSNHRSEEIQNAKERGYLGGQLLIQRHTHPYKHTETLLHYYREYEAEKNSNSSSVDIALKCLDIWVSNRTALRSIAYIQNCLNCNMRKNLEEENTYPAFEALVDRVKAFIESSNIIQSHSLINYFRSTIIPFYTSAGYRSMAEEALDFFIKESYNKHMFLIAS